ncbi:hypothetical protein T492DRAFT_832925 [Pavlovales sp. CCMP2436]|nr:hypothetical protein T492DRAFT_832925 [Pavlovales sp. CCMP2436]
MARIFEGYCAFGDSQGRSTTTMTSRNFAKLAKDCKFVDSKLTSVVLDLAFTKASRASTGSSISFLDSSSGKRISYPQFQLALQFCAEAKSTTVQSSSWANPLRHQERNRGWTPGDFRAVVEVGHWGPVSNLFKSLDTYAGFQPQKFPGVRRLLSLLVLHKLMIEQAERGPSYHESATVATPQRFHDDKRTSF